MADFERAAACIPARLRKEVLPAIGWSCWIPIVLLGSEAAREARFIVDCGGQAEQNGLPLRQSRMTTMARHSVPIYQTFDIN